MNKGQLTFLSDAKVNVDELIEVAGELQVHFFAVISLLLLLKQHFDRGERNESSHKVHAIEFLDQGGLDLVRGGEHGVGEGHGLRGARH